VSRRSYAPLYKNLPLIKGKGIQVIGSPDKSLMEVRE